MNAVELAAQLRSNPDWVRRDRERAQSHAEAVKKVRDAVRPEQEPLLRALATVGWHVESVWDLVNTKRRYPEAVPILVDYLSRSRHPVLREGIARALTVSEARGEAAQIILQELKACLGETSEVPFALANALSVVGDSSMLDSLVALRDSPKAVRIAAILGLAIKEIEGREKRRNKKNGLPTRPANGAARRG